MTFSTLEIDLFKRETVTNHHPEEKSRKENTEINSFKGPPLTPTPRLITDLRIIVIPHLLLRKISFLTHSLSIDVHFV
jgi:hypothetical protein